MLQGPEHLLEAGALRARFLPALGMLCASLQHDGEELLRRVDDLERWAEQGEAAGVPLLHPWANRLASGSIRRHDQGVAIDEGSSLLKRDHRGLLLHGVPWSRLRWSVRHASAQVIGATLQWDSPALLAVFPFVHQLRLLATLDSHGLTIETHLVAGREGPVPVSFGFHPYLGLGGHRSTWRLHTPPMVELTLDERMLPTGERRPVAASDAPLDARGVDQGFALPTGASPGAARRFALADSVRSIGVELIEGYGFAQVYAPAEHNYVCLEPMTAPTNALVTGEGLTWVAPGAHYAAIWRLAVEASDAARRRGVSAG